MRVYRLFHTGRSASFIERLTFRAMMHLTCSSLLELRRFLDRIIHIGVQEGIFIIVGALAILVEDDEMLESFLNICL